MKNLFKKFFITTLSFVMMIACAFTFTTNKASASTNSMGLASFARAVANQMLEEYTGIGSGGGSYYKACLLIDGSLLERDEFTDITIDLNTTTGDLIQSTFIVELADELNILLNNANTGEVEDLSNFFHSNDLELLIYLTSYRYLRFTTSSYVSFANASQFYDRTENYINSNTAIFAATSWNISSSLLTVLEGLAANLAKPILVYPPHYHVDISHTYLNFMVYHDDTDSFTTTA